jgi:peptidoglycan glycosyltransferase
LKTVGFRSIVLYILLAVFIGGVGYLVANMFLHGRQWVMQPYNAHLSGQMGDIKDRDGNLLATSQDGGRVYSENDTVRRALLHTIGDTAGFIGTGVQSVMGDKLTGYNFITGLNDTVFSRMGSGLTLTVSQDACTAAYNAMAGRNGAAILYNYENGDILCKVSAPTFDPAFVPEDIETNDAYKGAYLDKPLSASFTPGSIFKIITAAAAMEKWPDSWSERTYECWGAENIGGSDITCLHGEAHGSQDMFAAMGNSCNIYFAHLANDIGGGALQKKAEEMGFNQSFDFNGVNVTKSTLDLTGANANQIGWAAVGQYTVLANPYHMMALMGAVAKDGSYTQPRLTEGGDIFSGLAASGDRKLMSAETARQLKTLLRGDVENYYGDWMFPQGMAVCAKTGTGEVGEGKAPNCWMVGFCDSTQYPYAFAVVVEEGEGGIETAGVLVSAMLQALA